MNYNTIDQVDVTSKRVLLRVDYNVPTDESGKVLDDRRIQRTLPLLNDLIQKQAKIIIMSHKGRPKGKVVESERMDGVAKHLSKLLNKDVKKVDEAVGEQVSAAVGEMQEGEVLVVENLRFYPQEKSKVESERDEFGKQLAELGDLYVNEAFANSHRAHASMTSIPTFLPSFAGPSLTREIETISKAIQDPKHPFIAILGGKKGDKISVLRNLINKCDKVILAGALGYYFLQQRGVQVGEVKIDLEGVEFPADLLNHEKLVLPVDAVIAQEFANNAKTDTVMVDEIPKGWIPFDIGAKTCNEFAGVLRGAKTVIWAGAIGAYEAKPFASGTQSILQDVTQPGVTCIVGGGDTAASVDHFGKVDAITHISTGGGAALKLFSGEELVAIKALEENKVKFQ